MKYIESGDDDEMDLVDKNDKVIGTINQADEQTLLKSKAGFIRGVVAFIQNSEGKMWIPKRTAHKRIAPNGLDFSVAEHVQRGENYEQAIIRGFKEELLLDIDKSKLSLLGILEPIPQLPYFFIAVYVYSANEVSDYNKTDFSNFQWLSAHSVIELIDKGVPCKIALKPAIQKFMLI